MENDGVGRGMRPARAGDGAAMERVFTGLGERLASLRTARGVTQEALAGRIGISTSTLSRLEGGLRRPTVDLVLRIALAFGVSLDELVGFPGFAQFRVPPVRAEEGPDRVVWPLTRSTVEPVPYKIVYAVTETVPPSRLPTHPGWLWMFVIAGRLRLVVGGDDLVLETGEAVDIDTTLPHWAGSTGEGPVEVLALVGHRGERATVRIATEPDELP